LKFYLILVALANSLTLNSQITASSCSQGLIFGFDGGSHIGSGFYNNQTGYDEITKESRFTCQFYFMDKIENSHFEINSYYPNHKELGTIQGTLEIISSTEFAIQLKEEHRGFVDFIHFSNEPVNFRIEKPKPWISIRCIYSDKTYFYKNSSDNLPIRSYVLKDDLICVDEIISNKAHDSFKGKKVTTGWILPSDLNNIN